MTGDEFADFVEKIALRAVGILVKEGEHMPTVFLVPPPGVELTVPQMIVMPDGATDVVRRVVKQQGCIGTVLVITCWSAPASSVEWGLRPSEDPARRERLCISWEYREPDGHKNEGTWTQWFRRDGERIVLEEQSVETEALVAGPFVPFIV